MSDCATSSKGIYKIINSDKNMGVTGNGWYFLGGNEH
jgi:hypothetical protein